jgi:hypothetical protein
MQNHKNMRTSKWIKPKPLHSYFYRECKSSNRVPVRFNKLRFFRRFFKKVKYFRKALWHLIYIDIHCVGRPFEGRLRNKLSLLTLVMVFVSELLYSVATASWNQCLLLAEYRGLQYLKARLAHQTSPFKTECCNASRADRWQSGSSEQFKNLFV